MNTPDYGQLLLVLLDVYAAARGVFARFSSTTRLDYPHAKPAAFV